MICNVAICLEKRCFKFNESSTILWNIYLVRDKMKNISIYWNYNLYEVYNLFAVTIFLNLPDIYLFIFNKMHSNPLLAE